MEQHEFDFRRSSKVMISALEQWDRMQGPLLRVRESDLAWNLTSQDLVSYREATLSGVPVIFGIATEKGLTQGMSTATIWLSLWGEIHQGLERDFALEFIRLGKSLDKTRFVIGADEFHFVPGLPMGTPGSERLKNALLSLGFEGSMAYDLIGSAQSAEVSQYIESGLQLAKERRWSFELLPDDKNDESYDQLSSFLAKEFPGRWTREFTFLRSRPDTERAIWATLQDDEREIIGFARMCSRGRLIPSNFGWTPGALRLPLWEDIQNPFQDQDGCLGPIGVATSQRGQGTGKSLLAFVLNTLKDKSINSVCIDWTDALKYYEPLGYRIVRQYWTARKSGAN